MQSVFPIVGYVYLITNLVNGKKYVGCTKVSVERRWYEHCRVAKSDTKWVYAIQAAIRKYGIDSFCIECLETINGTYADLMAAEKPHHIFRTFKHAFRRARLREGVL